MSHHFVRSLAVAVLFWMHCPPPIQAQPVDPPAALRVSGDCNLNQIDDSSEIASGLLTDCNANGHPDECEICGTESNACETSAQCCSPHPESGCGCGACCASVCAADPFCCEGAWDEICAGAAKFDPNCPCVAGGFRPGSDCDADGQLDECQPDAPWKGYFLNFSGVNSYVSVSESDTLRLGAEFTLEAWIRPRDRGTHSNLGGVIINKEGEYELARFPDGTIHVALANGVPGWTWMTTNFVAPLHTWTHVAAVYDSRRRFFQLVADGVEVFVAEGSVGGAINDVDPEYDEFRIGARQRIPQLFVGDIDEVRIWNVARTVTEIAADRNRWLSGAEPGLIGYWRLNEGEGSIVEDRAGNHHGTISSAKWIASDACRPVRADLDGDGVVNAADVSLAVPCVSGPTATEQPQGCMLDTFGQGDIDGDADIDLADFREMLP